VRLTRAFYFGVHEVTVENFQTFVTATAYKTTAEKKGSARGIVDGGWGDVDGLSWRKPRFEQDKTHPVTCVSWLDAMAFCEWLSDREKRTYRLPTEAEWECACRGGTDTVFFWGDEADDGEGYLNSLYTYKDDYKWTSPAGCFKANALGLHDMQGNVAEWCSCWSGKYDASPADDPTGAAVGSFRMRRGGGWFSSLVRCRSADRMECPPDYRRIDCGFRVAITITDAPPAVSSASASTMQDQPERVQDQPERVQEQPSLLVAPFDAQAAEQAQQRWADYLNTEVTSTNSIGMKLKLIPAGEFMMGSAKSPQEIARLFDLDEDHAKYLTGENPQHRVRITKAFYLGVTEVTQGQWEAVMGSRPWSGDDDQKEGPDYAATYVIWEDAVEFCEKLSSKEGVTYRLPTEAEWEYACRVGTTTIYHFGDDESRLGDYTWFCDNAYSADDKYAHRVGRKKANPFGLYDMHGNVYEWCHDRYGEDYYAGSPTDDPTGAEGGSFRALRGGSWIDVPCFCRSAFRFWCSPEVRDGRLGFRVAMTVADATGAIGQGLTSPLPEGTLAEFHKRWEANRESLEKASQLYSHDGPEVRRLERQKEALSNQAVELAKQAKAEVDQAQELRDSLIAQGRAEDSPLVRGADEELRAKSELLGSLAYCLPRQFRERMFGKSGIVPPGLEAAFIVPVSGQDQHRNPVHARNGSLFDLETGWSFEIWLKEPRMELVFIPAGEFTMGSTLVRRTSDPYRLDATPAHRVRITKPFYISKYEVTEAQRQWTLSDGPAPATKSGGAAQHPAGNTSWQDWQTFCGKLNQKMGLKGFRLPTEAEWEYACRAGTTTLFFFGDDPAGLEQYAQHESFETPRGKGGPRPVGQKRPNGWGLYDVYGNLFEWCQDWSGPYQNGLQIDPAGPTGGPGRVNRGGQAWLYGTEGCNSSYRHWNRANRYEGIGARIVLSLP